MTRCTFARLLDVAVAAPLNPDWLVPQWPAPARVRAACTTRAGGVSTAPFDSLNLGDHVGDSADHVAANRAVLRSSLGVSSVFLSQVHGTAVTDLHRHTAPGIVADACFTEQPGLACTIMVADCLPVLFTNACGTAVAAAHAGWRSLLGHGGRGVLEAVVKRFSALEHVQSAQAATEIIAWLGPCIGPQAFEVGAEVRAAFAADDTAALNYFQPTVGGKWLADLPGLARWRLQRLGVGQIFGNNGQLDWCTVHQPSRFFSYRRDGVTGRQAACVWLG